MTNRISNHAFLSYAFRPMFLGLGIFALLNMAMWIGPLVGAIPIVGAYGPLWHAHEMLFGFALAAVAGFLLTAVATWTGRPPVQGLPLLMLFAAWLLGRIVMAMGLPPSTWLAGVAMVFPVLLTVFVAREVILGGSRRNYQVVGMVAALTLLDGLYHLSTLGIIPGARRLALLAALYLLVVLVTVIAGRIIPSFTANWLRARGSARLPASIAWVERLAVPMTAVTGVLAVVLTDHLLTGIAAALTALVHTLRLVRWRGLSTLAEPLLFVLHVAYAWLPAGFALLAAAILSDTLPSSIALHAFGVGAIGTMILAVTSRVALGHTGRPLHADYVTVISYVALAIAVVARITAPAADNHYLTVIAIAALGWFVAWSLFLWTYTPILLRPRSNSR
ncbi:MAG: NnrS family protein [Gammaproteobacteria bacterium]